MTTQSPPGDLAGTDDPAGGISAPIGTRYIRTDTGDSYLKIGPLDTDWGLVAIDPAGTGSIIYGSGQDGVADFDGANTFTYASKLGSVYTVLRDLFLAGPSFVRPGVTLVTGGYRIFCNGTLTVGVGGIIHNDGKAAALNVAGGASLTGTLGVGTNGGTGHVGVGAGTAGGNQLAANTLGDATASGGAGGAGGADAGGAGGTYVPNAGNGGSNFLAPMQTGYLFTQGTGGNFAVISPIGGGAGGGGGGSDNAGVNGGGGGGGGGVLMLHVYNLINNGTIRSNGGVGGNAAGGGGNGGGGGGGGGGVILSLAARRSGTGAYQTNGGTGGTAIGAGVVGATGNAGHQNLFYGGA